MSLTAQLNRVLKAATNMVVGVFELGEGTIDIAKDYQSIGKGWSEHQEQLAKLKREADKEVHMEVTSTLSDMRKANAKTLKAIHAAIDAEVEQALAESKDVDLAAVNAAKLQAFQNFKTQEEKLKESIN